VRRVRFAASPTGTLDLGDALSAVAARRLGGALLLRIDDTDAAGSAAVGEEAIVDDLRWLRIDWDEGPVRQSERRERHREVAAALGGTPLRDDRAIPRLASVVDDVDFGITHVVRGVDHRPDEAIERELFLALGAEPPELVYHGLMLGPDASVASLRQAGVPAEAVRGYLEELGLPRHDVRLDLARVRRLAVETIAALPDEELTERVGVPRTALPVLRGARDLNEARLYADQVLRPPPPAATASPETLLRFGELVTLEPKALVRELNAVGGDLKALRLALTGRDRGPELSAILAALGPEEAMRRVDQALQHTRS
jgi:glutamyl/glutaminyl-tRNA synthetase